ncbi:MAG: phospholipase D family protein [Hyphomicrobiaceae bacterium]
MSGAWSSQAYLDALRPVPGSVVTGAILASYSADLVSIVAALLALAGRDNEEGSGGKADLAEAVELLRGKVRILIQRGRLARPKRIPGLAGILDQFICQIDFDENERSWHPKLALVRLSNGAPGDQWRLWLGSRNLTGAVNRDFGLLLTSSDDPKSDAAPVAGIDEMAARVAGYAKLDGLRPSKLKSALRAIRWIQPDKLHIERIMLTPGKVKSTALPSIKEADEVIAVSPFLDGTIVKMIGSWGGPKTKRSLLSTQLELVKLARQVSKPLAGFGDRIFLLESPAPEAVEPSAVVNDDAAADDDESEQLPIGLHAKILAVRKGKVLRLWVGSANATERAWMGANVEVIGEVSAPAHMLEGLHTLLIRPVSGTDLEKLKVPEEDAAAERLEKARKRFVASWNGRLSRDGNAFVIESAKLPHPLEDAVHLEAGLATANLVPWPRGQASLPLGTFPVGLHTQLVQFRMLLGELSCSWLQCVDVSPPLDAERDRRAIARHLGMSTFLAWIAALLGGDCGMGEAGERWDNAAPAAGSQTPNFFDPSILTLDAMLACWARDRTSFKRASERIDTYLGPIIAEAEALPAGEAERLRSFQSVWAVVSGELLKER